MVGGQVEIVGVIETRLVIEIVDAVIEKIELIEVRRDVEVILLDQFSEPVIFLAVLVLLLRCLLVLRLRGLLGGLYMLLSWQLLLHCRLFAQKVLLRRRLLLRRHLLVHAELLLPRLQLMRKRWEGRLSQSSLSLVRRLDLVELFGLGFAGGVRVSLVL